MKKLWIGLSAAVLVVSLCVTGALAAGRHSRWNTGAGGVSGCSAVCFTDADGDGVCDNSGTGCGWYYTDADGDGVCDNSGTGCGRYYTDADGDGVCDNFGTGLDIRRGCGQHGGCRNH